MHSESQNLVLPVGYQSWRENSNGVVMGNRSIVCGKGECTGLLFELQDFLESQLRENITYDEFGALIILFVCLFVCLE